VVIGNARKFPSALIVPAKGADRDAIAQEVAALNESLAHHEQIKKFELLETDFTIDGGELTPTMKVRRKVVEQKYKAQIDSMYAE